MTMRALPAALVAASAALCCVAPLAAQYDTDQMRAAYETTDQALRARLSELAPHFARVRKFRELERRRVDGEGMVFRQRYDLGSLGGLVVTGEPLVLVSGSAASPSRSQMSFNENEIEGLSELRYEFLLDDGSTIPAVVAQREAALNLWLLRPAPGAPVPDELRRPFPLPATGRRPAANEFFGIVALEAHQVRTGRDGRPLSAAPGGKQLQARVGLMPPGKDFYARPALIFSVGIPDFGMPAFAADGTFLGIANMQPPEAGIPEWSTIQDPRLMPMDTDRDPNEFAGNSQSPVLLSADEVLPLLRRLQERAEEPRRFDPLGLVVGLRAARLEVLSVDEGGPLAGRVAAGDAIVKVGGVDVFSADDFMAALEKALESVPVLQLDLARDGKPIEASITLE